MVTILNSSILTTYGDFKYIEISLRLAKELVAEGFISAVGHPATAEVISTLLGIDCQPHRMEYKQSVGEAALIFKLLKRIPEEGKILSKDEIEKIGYTWGLLTRIS